MEYETVSFPRNDNREIIARLNHLVQTLRPSSPLHIMRRPVLKNAVQKFITQFDGTVMYAVKSNPDEAVILALAQAGLSTFDAASIEEVRLVKRLVPDAKIHFMHTVKSREAIRESYFDHGVRVFVIDTLDELHKIIHETALANDLTIFVRLALPKNKQAAVDFSAKFGATPKGAALLLHEARLVSSQLGIMFHPGTQSSDPEVFARGIEAAAKVIKTSAVQVDLLDIGGGFPAPYPGQIIPSLIKYMDVIADAVSKNHLNHLELLCEPGRALVAEAGYLVTRIEQRKEKALYLNDGVYGGLVEAAKWQGSLQFPVFFVPCHPEWNHQTSEIKLFRFCGPTCDSLDMMKGPFPLPSHANEGDWVIVGMTGAYSNACRTNFNGFGQSTMIMVDF